MSYTINRTVGSTLTSVVDGTIDQTSTDLVLIGKNSSSYGTYINDNFVSEEIPIACPSRTFMSDCIWIFPLESVLTYVVTFIIYAVYILHRLSTLHCAMSPFTYAIYIY